MSDSGVTADHISTEAIAPKHRVAIWREVFGRTIAKLDFEPLSDGRLVAEATRKGMPGLGMFSMSSNELRFRKLPGLIDNDDLILAIVETGTWSGSQLGREAHLAAGDAVLCSNAEVAVGVASGRRSMVRLPAKAIAPFIGDPNAAVLRRIPAHDHALCLLKGYLATLRGGNAAAPAELQRLAVTHVYDLVALTLGATREGAEVAKSRGARAARLRAIKDEVARRAHEHGLSIGAIARRLHLTPRCIQLMFEGDGTTFTEFVLDERLARAHRMLASAACADRKISAIAYDAGFGDLSYFIRAFRRRYGALPSDVRMRAQSIAASERAPRAAVRARDDATA